MRKNWKLNTPRTKLVLDLGLMTAFVVSMEPHFTGFTWHEWIGIALAGAALIHIAFNWKWIVTVTKRFFGKTARQARINYLLNIALFFAFFLTAISGILISENLNTTQVLGIAADAAQTWKMLHKLMPDITLIIVALHLALHWKWLLNAAQRYLFRLPLRRKPAQVRQTGSAAAEIGPAR